VRNAELIAVGSELLRFGRRDTNTEWLSKQLNRIGIEVSARVMVEDELATIATSLRTALDRSPVVVVTGGIGPTEDDRTREAVAQALGLELERDEERVAALRARFEERGYPFKAAQARQAERPIGSSWIDNPIGTAAGFLAREGERTVFVLPGVPAEMRAMFQRSVLPRLSGGSALASRVLKVGGRTESSVDERVSDLYGLPGSSVTILTGREGVELHLRAVSVGQRSAREVLDEIDRRVSERLGTDVYGRDDETLPSVVGRMLRGLGRTVSTAESCTAGMLAATMTNEPGSSAWFRGGFVVYSDDLKQQLVGVGAELLRAHGAVSEAVARELALGARQRCGADYGIAITGIAGPSGGTPTKPVGLVHLSIACGSGVGHWRLRLVGDRDSIRRRTVTAALDRLRRELMRQGGT
jgi:nicotinamide-nucleotide amidase